jgi:N-acetylneuraminic acid mutarotase
MNKIKKINSKINHKLAKRFRILRNRQIRLFAKTGFIVLIVTVLFIILQSFLVRHTYSLEAAGSLLSPVNQSMADKIKFDSKKQQFTFNNGQSLESSESTQTGAQNISAIAYTNPSKGVSVTDTINKIDFNLTPKYDLISGKQDGNRIIYPFRDGTGWTVYTIQGTGVKEDIVINKKNGDTKTFEYILGLGDGLEARVESDGGIGVYGNTLFSSNITASTDADAALLLKARENATKDTLIFNIPKPVIIETGGNKSDVKAAYSLQDNNLKVNVTGLEKANYPLSIDPSIYVVTAQQFMNGNNETNIDFDVTNKLIKKSPTTGARFDTWKTTTDLPTAVWGASSVAAGGYIYSVGGTSKGGQIYNTQGADTFVVPSGVTSIEVKIWSGGGGGGAGGSAAAGGAGGGSGYVNAEIPVTPGESLTIYVGGGGRAGVRNTAGGGGGGGGYSSIYRGSTLLAIVGGGGGGGGGTNAAARTGGFGGAGGGTTGLTGGTAGGTAPLPTGGIGGSPTAGGAAGTLGTNVGTAGSSLAGGLGGNGRNNAGADGGAANGGAATGGAGGSVTTTTYAAGGGGGSGYFGGGGGSSSRSTNSNGGSGGGGGSSYTRPTDVTMIANTAGSGINPGNSGDISRNGAGTGGNGGAVAGVGTAGANGLVYVLFGTSGMTTVNQSVSWAQFNTTTGTIDSANPGSGTCSGWCTTAAYNLPAARTNFSLVAYNGFLYAMGGVDGTGNRQNTVYIAKLGASGEPQLWHPTNTDKSTWNYWYTDTTLSSIRSDATAVAYNNRMYLMGGRSTGGTPVNTVEIADITPTGKLGTWTASTNLPSNLYGHSAQVYNDRLYIIGGVATVGGAPSNSVYYNKINDTGTLNAWVQTTSFATGRISNGGNLSTVWGAYIYISGGCSAINGSGYCTAISSDTQVASINADGSIDIWNTVGGVSSERMGSSFVAWRNNVYEIGGCSAQNVTTGDCNNSVLSTIIYGKINQDGDASTVAQSVALNTAPCSGASPTGCNLPGTAYIGNMLSATIITNGYLYVIGGCTNNGCTTTVGNVAYVAISSTGVMTKPATCTAPKTTQGGTWCVDTTNIISGGIAATSPLVFGGQIYLVGGNDGSGNINAINRATINNDGSLSSWTSQSMSDVGATSVSFNYAYARANPASASTYPGNLYIFGGCTTTSGAGCTAYTQRVYKCNIAITTGAISGCDYTTQLQIGIIPGDTAAGLGIMSGTVYANYIYLIGGVSPNLVDLKTIHYAKFDDSNNIVAVTGSTWVESPNQMEVGRRRAAAFGYNGYIYVVGGYDATEGVLADIEFIKVNVSDGSLGSATDGFHVSSVTINQRWGLSVSVSNSFAYVIGGCTTGASPGGCTVRTDIIQTFQVYNNDSGAPAGYTTSATTYSTNPNRIGASSVILNGYIYVAGGCTSATDCTTAINTVSYAPIDVYGAIGPWLDTTGVWPSSAVRTWGKLLTAGGTLYYIGGQSSTATDRRTEVYYGTPASGNITTWSAASNPLPAARTKFGAAVWNNRLYVVGGEGTGTGCTASNVCNTVYVSPQLNAGGNITTAWSTTSASFDTARSGLAVTAYANNIYLFGGYDGTNYLSDSQYAQLNASTGVVGAWTFSASLPLPLSQSEAFAANGYVYLMGGRSATTVCDPVALVAPISANTTIASGNNPTGIGEWYETNQRFTGSRYGASAAYYNGKAYVMGGGCGATVTYASPVTQQTTLLSQPQVAKYSIMVDTDSDVFPNQWLLNGLDNSIGAAWQLKYRSMPNTTTSCVSPSMTTWGSETNFGNVTLGLPGIYTPKNSSGVSTNCARFYYFNVTIDSSQAFGYPDDVSRGPTISDLTLQFTADPSKRLMHGRTFTGGLQQPIDTPYYSH